MRREAREIAFKLIFQSEFNKESDVELSFESIAEEYSINKEDENFALELFNAYKLHSETIKEKIAVSLKNYEIERVYKVDLALIELALTEIKYLQTPEKIVFNEVLELAKKFSTDNSAKFLNGVIGELIKE